LPVLNENRDARRRNYGQAGLMIARLKKIRRMTKRLILLALLIPALALSGCQTISFYRQAIQGQISLITHQQRSDKLIADPGTPAPLKEKLQLVSSLRTFAK